MAELESRGAWAELKAWGIHVLEPTLGGTTLSRTSFGTGLESVTPKPPPVGGGAFTGFGFMAHGWAKLSRGPAGFAKLLAQIGAPLPEATAWVSTFIEMLGGLAIFVGAFVEIVSIPLIVMMLVAMFTVHLKYGFSSINTIGLTEDGPKFGPPGYEVNLLYIAGLFSLILAARGLCPSTGCSRRRKNLSERPGKPMDAA